MRSKHSQRQQHSGYDAGPPWVFSGRAFYQLHLVKVDVAKRFIPSDLRIVQAFGYTLGGLYLAHYDASPADAFDEEVGLPSRMADFSKFIYEQRRGGWRWNFLSHDGSREKDLIVKRSAIHINEVYSHLEKPLCQMVLPLDYGSMKINWHGPTISLSLPSFSGRTEQQPHLLKYSCKLKCSVKPMKPASIMSHDTETESGESLFNSVQAVLTSKPIMALCFYNMEMHVEAAKIVDSS